MRFCLLLLVSGVLDRCLARRFKMHQKMQQKLMQRGNEPEGSMWSRLTISKFFNNEKIACSEEQQQHWESLNFVTEEDPAGLKKLERGHGYVQCAAPNYPAGRYKISCLPNDCKSVVQVEGQVGWCFVGPPSCGAYHKCYPLPWAPVCSIKDDQQSNYQSDTPFTSVSDRLRKFSGGEQSASSSGLNVRRTRSGEAVEDSTTTTTTTTTKTTTTTTTTKFRKTSTTTTTTTTRTTTVTLPEEVVEAHKVVDEITETVVPLPSDNIQAAAEAFDGLPFCYVRDQPEACEANYDVESHCQGTGSKSNAQYQLCCKPGATEGIHLLHSDWDGELCTQQGPYSPPILDIKLAQRSAIPSQYTGRAIPKPPSEDEEYDEDTSTTRATPTEMTTTTTTTRTTTTTKKMKPTKASTTTEIALEMPQVKKPLDGRLVSQRSASNMSDHEEEELANILRALGRSPPLQHRTLTPELLVDPDSYPGERISVKMEVKDFQQLPVEGAVVEALDGTVVIGRSAPTNSKGFVKFKIPDKTTLSVKHRDYSPWKRPFERSVNCPNSADCEIGVNLNPKSGGVGAVRRAL